MAFGSFSMRKKKVELEIYADGNEIPAKSKYGAKKTEIDGYKFDSKGEARCYEFLRDEPMIDIVEMQPRYTLQDKYTTKDGRKIRAIEYIADFLIIVGGDAYIVDFKGMKTPVFLLKVKMFEKRYPDEILVIAKNMKELKLAIL